MIKYKLSLIWVILFISTIFISVLSVTASLNPIFYNIGLAAGVILVFLSCPVCFIDTKLASKYEIKKKEQLFAKKIEEKEKEYTVSLKKSELELKAKELDLKEEQLKVKELKSRLVYNASDDDGIKIICNSCGKEVDSQATICTYCGRNLNE